MDSDDEEMLAALLEDDEEMLAALLEEEADGAATDDEEHMQMLACLAGLYAADAQPKRGGSAPNRQKSKPRQRAEGYCMLYADYFADDPLHGEKRFRRRFRMNRKLFLKIVHGVREFDRYLVLQEGLHRHGWIFLAPEMHCRFETARIRSSS